jgi:hypothetical protein
VPNHGERPTGEEFDRIATEYRARMAAVEDTAALDVAMYTLVVGQAVAEWQALLTAVQQLDHIGGGPVGYRGVSRAGRDRRADNRAGAVSGPVGR